MRFLSLFMFFVLVVATSASAGTYNYINEKEMKNKIETGSEVVIVDIQLEEELKQNHLPGSIATSIRNCLRKDNIDKVRSVNV